MVDVRSDEVMRAIYESHGVLPQMMKGTGWVPQAEDERDFRLKTLLGSSTPPKKATDLIQHEPPARDQIVWSSCTGFTGAAGVGLLVRKAGAFETLYSPLFIYNLVRDMIGEINVDEGAYLRDVAQVLRKVGAARERDFPYYEVEDNLYKLPPKKAYESAKSWRLGAFYKCETLNDVKRAIAAGHPVMGGFLVYPNLMSRNVAANGLVPEPGGSPIGGHAVLFTSYDDSMGRVRFLNSWHRKWGNNGAGFLPYSFFTGGHTGDLTALVDESPDTVYPLRAA